MVSIIKNMTVFSLVTLSLIVNVYGDNMNQEKKIYTSIDEVPQSDWNELSTKKIYFGHQSVGFNIVAGLEDLIKEHPQIKLNIVESSSKEVFNKPVFAHSRNGENGDAESKINAFAEKMSNGIGNTADIAFFKFCFVDVNWDTNVKEIFSMYKNKMAMLGEKYHNTKFINLTVPLLVKEKKTVLEKIKNNIKEIFKKPTKSFFDNDNNIARNNFNKMIRDTYSANGSIFDIAKYESTYKDGHREIFNNDGNREYNALISDYSKDGGHLNERGRKIIAEKLLLFLINMN